MATKAHSHDHHHDHAHGVARDADKKYLTIALLLLLGFMVVEVVIGIMARSLALLSDAGHMLTDVGSIGLALLAMRWSALPPKGGFTFGFKRAEILSAQANGLTLIVLAIWIIYEAIRRFIVPAPVQGALVTGVAFVGIGVNLLAVWAMSRANRQSMNVEGSFQHILTDLYAFIATAMAGGIIWWTGWSQADVIASLLVAALMLKAGYGLLRDSGRIFLEAAPSGINPVEVKAAILAVPHVHAVEDLHIWEVTSAMPALSAHLYLDRAVSSEAVRAAVESILHDRFAILHTTLQTDQGSPKRDNDHEASCTFDIPSKAPGA